MGRSPVYLYILMRTDLASMNPGKMCAQASHCANQMVFEADKKIAELHRMSPECCGDEDIAFILAEWEHQTPSGFGTCIVLGVKEMQLRKAIGMARELGLHAGITHDPTYPLMDGETLHLIPLDTCGYIFCRKEAASLIVSNLSLLP